MIHTLHGPPAPTRRIAVIQIPRAQQSRLGRIGTIRSFNWVAGPDTTSLNSWVPVTDLMPVLQSQSSSVTPEEWQAFIQQSQALAQTMTPGTLTYTPAPATPGGTTIEPPWSSWQTSGCNPDPNSATSIGAPAPASIAAATAPSTNAYGPGGTPWVVIAGFLGAAASLVYLRQAAKGRS